MPIFMPCIMLSHFKGFAPAMNLKLSSKHLPKSIGMVLLNRPALIMSDEVIHFHLLWITRVTRGSILLNFFKYIKNTCLVLSNESLILLWR